MDEAGLAQAAEAFRRDGFVHVPGALDPDEVRRLAAHVDAAVAGRTRLDARPLAEKSPYEQSFTQCQSIWEDYPEVGALTFHPAIGRIAAALLGAKAVRLWHDQALYKAAGGRETEAHQDHPYWPITEEDATATVWIPLVEVTRENGCMGYVPGSHRGVARFIDIFSKPGDGKALEAAFADTPPVFVEAQPGDVIFHHGKTVHLTGPNATGRTRAAYTAIYFADGCTRSTAMPHPSVDRSGIAVGAVIDGDATPIVWPLPDGRRPKPAPWPSYGRRAQRAADLGVIPQSGGLS